MKSGSSSARGAQRRARSKQTKPPPLTQMVVLDAVRTWVIPTVAISVSLLLLVAYNAGVLDEGPALTSVGTLALITVLFFGVRSFLAQPLSGSGTLALVVFVAFWAAATFYPFYRTINPGTPLFDAELKRATPPVHLPLAGKPGRYSLLVEGHFVPAQDRVNRTATYHMALGHEGATDRVLEGTLQQEWRRQRFGAGRRSTVVPALHQTTRVREVIEDPDGRELTLSVTDLSPELRDGLNVRLYAEPLSTPLLIALAALTMAAAVGLDVWRPLGADEGLMATLTFAVLVALLAFRNSTTSLPGFPQLMVAVLAGTVFGAVGGAVLWRGTRVIRRRLVPERPTSRSAR